MASAIISVVLVAFFRLRIRGSGPILERANFFPVQPVYTEPCKFLLQIAVLLAVQQLVLFFRVPCKRKVIRASSCLFRQNFVRTRVDGVLRWCYTRRFATTIFSAAQRCNIVATFSFEWLQHCSNIATLCCAKNRRFESSRVTSPLLTADVVDQYVVF